MAWESANDGDICTGNLATPNFSLNGIALGNTLVAPTPGSTASLGKTSYDHRAAANGTTSIEQTVSEVGSSDDGSPADQRLLQYHRPAKPKSAGGAFYSCRLQSGQR